MGGGAEGGGAAVITGQRTSTGNDAQWGGLYRGYFIRGIKRTGPKAGVAFFSSAWSQTCLSPRDQFLDVRKISIPVHAHTHTHTFEQHICVCCNQCQVLNVKPLVKEEGYGRCPGI